MAWVCREGSGEEKTGQDLASSHSWTRFLLEVQLTLQVEMQVQQCLKSGCGTEGDMQSLLEVEKRYIDPNPTSYCRWEN